MSKDRIKLGIKSLKVKYHNRNVGILAVTNSGEIAFSYDNEWLENGFSISPFSLPLESKVFVPKNYYFDGWFLDKNLTNVVIYPLKVEDNMTLYAKWVKISDKLYFENCEFKYLDCDYSSKALYDITPRSFNYSRLEELGYTSMNICVEYSVSYEKQYEFLWDIGYFGSPRYEVSISNDDCWGEFQEDIKTTDEYVCKIIEINAGFDYYNHTPIVLMFSTNNIQNVVKVKDISVSYICL